MNGGMNGRIIALPAESKSLRAGKSLADSKKRTAKRGRKRESKMAENKKVDNKKITKITLRDGEGNSYTLEFNKRTVKAMERNGFKMDTDYPYTMVDDLFRGAFQMHHKGMMRERIEEIWAAQTKKEDLLTALIQIYNAPMEEMMSDAEGEDETPTWTAV